MVAGVMHEGRAALVERFVAEADTVYLAREPQNRFSPNAIAVRLTNGLDIGYIPESEAIHLAPVLDEGALHSAAIKKILRGRSAPIPVVWGELYSAQARLDDAVTQAEVRDMCAPPAPPAVTPGLRIAASAVPINQSAVPSRATSRPSLLGRVAWIALALAGLALLLLWLA